MYKFCKLWLLGIISFPIILSSCSLTEPYILDIYDWFGLTEDNLSEELLEAGIEWQSGIEVDLTPSTPED